MVKEARSSFLMSFFAAGRAVGSRQPTAHLSRVPALFHFGLQQYLHPWLTEIPQLKIHAKRARDGSGNPTRLAWIGTNSPVPSASRGTPPIYTLRHLTKLTFE